MRLVGWPSTWEPEEGLLPVNVQDIDIHATKEELKLLSEFFASAALQAKGVESSVDFGDSKPNPKTGIWFTVHVTDNIP